MAINLNWINDYIDISEENKIELANKITNAGINVEKINTKHIDNLVIGNILECHKHPDSDHLNICQVDILTKIIQVVCGAHNVRKNLKVIVALPGAILLDNFEIKKSTIRGVDSEGMICALFELGLEEKTQENYDKGICELPNESPIGIDPIEYLELDQPTYDLDLNPNRTDCNNHISFAYEIAAVLNKKVTLPDISFNSTDEDISNLIKLDVRTDNLYFYNLMIAKNVEIKESPKFIKDRLESVGIRSINNVVDISNYVMLEYGNPLHFFDKDLVGDKVIVRMANENETLETLDGIERNLNHTDIVITNENEILCLGGVMGGNSSSVNNETKNILIESAIFNPYNIRQTSLRLNLRSEASLRFEKNLNFEYSLLAIKRACHLLEKYANAKIVKGSINFDNLNKDEKKISVSNKEINNILGLEIDDVTVQNILSSLGFEYEVVKDVYKIVIPNRRQDIRNQKEDIIEEIGRIYGFDKIPSTLPELSLRKGGYTEFVKFRKQVSRKMRSLGFFETRTYSLISENDIKKFNKNIDNVVKLNRPMSKDREFFRISLINSLFEIYNYNMSRKIKNIFLYEISNVYKQFENNYIEDTLLSILCAGDYIENSWNTKNYQADFYFLKGMIEKFLDFLGLNGRYSFILDKNPVNNLHPYVNSNVIVDGKNIGFIAKLHPNICKNDVYVCEISLKELFKCKTGKINFKEPNKYPSIKKDVAFYVDKNVESEKICIEIKKIGGKKLTNVVVFDEYFCDNDNKKSLAFNLTFESYERTLTDKEVMEIFEDIIDKISKKFNASLRDK